MPFGFARGGGGCGGGVGLEALLDLEVVEVGRPVEVAFEET